MCIKFLLLANGYFIGFQGFVGITGNHCCPGYEPYHNNAVLTIAKISSSVIP